MLPPSFHSDLNETMEKDKEIKVAAITSFGDGNGSFSPGDVFMMPADLDWLKAKHVRKARAGEEVNTYMGNIKHQPEPVVHTTAEAMYPDPDDPGNTITAKQLAAKLKKAAAAKAKAEA